MKLTTFSLILSLVLALATPASASTVNGWSWNMTPQADGLTATFWDGSEFTLFDNAGNLGIRWTDTLPDVTADWDNRIRGWIKHEKGCHFDIGVRPAADLPFWFVVRGDACHTGETTYFQMSSEREGVAYVETPHMPAIPLPATALLLLGALGALVWGRRV